MASHIKGVAIKPKRLTPTEAELIIEVQVAEVRPTTELRGRLMGPTCIYSSTIDIAYPVKMLPHRKGAHSIEARVLIPEPSWWDPESPFLYHGPIELWEHEKRVESFNLKCGLRHAEWRGDDLVWNGRPHTIRSQRIERTDDVSFKLLRDTGINTVIVPAAVQKTAWEIADRIGLFVVTEAGVEFDALRHPSALSVPLSMVTP